MRLHFYEKYVILKMTLRQRMFGVAVWEEMWRLEETVCGITCGKGNSYRTDQKIRVCICREECSDWIKLEILFARRNSVGVTPFFALNSRLKLLSSLNPHREMISLMLSSVVTKYRFATDNRHACRYSIGAQPVILLNK